MYINIESIIDNIENSRPKPRSCVKFPCGICYKSVRKNQKAVQCDSCDLWVHIGCNGTSNKEYELLKNSDDLWHCMLCIVKENLQNVPFTRCDNSELTNIYSSNSMKFINSLPSLEIHDETSKFSNLSLNEIYDEISIKSSSKYHSVNEFQLLNKSKSLNIFHTNINGLESKFDNFNEFLSSTNTKMDIVAITETSEKDEIGFLNNVEIEGYDFYHTASKSLKGGSAIYVNNKFNSIQRNDLEISNVEFESTWIEIKNKNSKNIVTGSIYRHPHNNSTDFFQYLEKCLSKLSKENKEVYICGDFNFDLLKIDTDSITQNFFNMLCSYSFLPNILQPTRVTVNTATVIDNIFSNNIQDEMKCGNILLTLSEHFSQFASIYREKIDFKKINMYQRDYSKFKCENFRDDVSTQNWNYLHDNVHASFQDFYVKLEGSVDRHAPLKKLSPKEIKLKSKPWLSSDIIKMIKIRNKIFARKKRQPENENCKQLYNIFRNRVNREIKKSKKQYYAEYFEKNVNCIKNIWEGIRNIVNVKKMTSKTIQLDIEGKIVDDDKELATNFNNFFVNVGPKTEDIIPKVPNISPSRFLKNRIRFNFVIAHVSNEEILEIINSLANKSSGPYSIPLKLLSQIPDLIIIPLAHIINISFLTGEYPELLKIVKVIPIHKGGSTQNLNNYRPISLLSIFDKIIEKIMHKKLYNFLETHNVLYQNQYGFRKNNSTVYALTQITEKIKSTIDNGKYGCGIFIDLRKAFDTVNHKILLGKLEHYGIRGNMLNWFESYLKDRKQFVSINGQVSDLKDITCGVPQGSVLGPLLFLLYINDLPNISKILNFYLFADDTNIYYESESLTKIEKTVNKELDKLYLWLNVNRLSLNIEKTNFIIFHPYNKKVKQSITIKINKKAIAEKEFIKYLGILVDSSLNWKCQISSISKKVSRALGIMYKLRPYLPLNVMKNVYYSLIHSHINYAIEIWGSAFKTEVDKILILQKRAMRMMTFNDKFPVVPGPLNPSNPIFASLEILKVDDMHKYQVAKFIFKSINKLTPENFHHWFLMNSEVYDHKTRSNFKIDDKTAVNNLFIPSARTTHYGMKLIKVSGPRIWNSLPTHLKQVTTLEIFLKKLKDHFLSGYD